MNNSPMPPRSRLLRIGLPAVIVLTIGGIVFLKRGALQQTWADYQQKHTQATGEKSDSSNRPGKRPLFELVPDKVDTFRIVGKDLASLGIKTYTIESNPPPKKLRLPGTLSLDPNRFVRVHSRFPGEVRKVGPAAGTNRPLQFGDKVSIGDLLAKIWSKDIGEKKSELVDAISRVHFDEVTLDRLNRSKDIVAQKAVTEAEKIYQADMVALQKAERTLRSWNFTEADIEAVRQETKGMLEWIKLQKKDTDQIPENEKSMIQAIIADDGHWAELDVFAAQKGEIAEKNFNVGDMVDTSNVLFKIADMDRLQVIANVFEEDVPSLRALSKDERRWSLELKSKAIDTAIPGQFDQIGIIVDSNMHTLPVMGYVDNTQRRLAIGQFVTATIEIPGDPTQIVIPVSAVVEEGSTSAVFVETNAELHEYTRRYVAVVSRGRTMMHVETEPAKYQLDRGVQSLRPGERVLTNSVVELDAELNDLISASPKK